MIECIFLSMTAPILVIPRRPPRPGTPPASWRDRVAALRYVPPLVRMVWQTHRGYAAAMVALRLVRAFVPIATLWVGKLIIDAVIAARQHGADWRRLWHLVALE